MRSRIVRDVAQKGFDRHSDRSRGQGRAGFRLASSSFMAIGSPVPNRLPVAQNDQILQNDSGDLIFLPGYSQMGGPDVMG